MFRALLCVAFALSACRPDVGAEGEGLGQATSPVVGGTLPVRTETATLVPDDAAAGDRFGGAVGISGPTIAVGAVGHDDFRGAVYLFQRQGSTWQETATLVPDDVAPGDFFGSAVAMSGDTLVVAGGATAQGAAYVFERKNGVWKQTAKLVPESLEEGMFATVAVDGSTIVAGAIDVAAYVYTRRGCTWTRQATLQPQTGGGDLFAWAVAVQNDTALVSAIARDDFTGAAYVFKRHAGTWQEKAILTADDGAPDDNFGESVALSGDTAVIGADQHESRGAAYVFGRAGGAWTQKDELQVDDVALFGLSVALRGNRMVVGAPGSLEGAGAAVVFERKNGTWTAKAQLVSSDFAHSSFLGTAVALSSTTIVVGDPAFFGPDGPLEGTTYLYQGTSNGASVSGTNGPDHPTADVVDEEHRGR